MAAEFRSNSFASTLSGPAASAISVNYGTGVGDTGGVGDLVLILCDARMATSSVTNISITGAITGAVVDSEQVVLSSSGIPYRSQTLAHGFRTTPAGTGGVTVHFGGAGSTVSGMTVHVMTVGATDGTLHNIQHLAHPLGTPTLLTAPDPLPPGPATLFVTGHNLHADTVGPWTTLYDGTFLFGSSFGSPLLSAYHLDVPGGGPTMEPIEQTKSYGIWHSCWLGFAPPPPALGGLRQGLGFNSTGLV